MRIRTILFSLLCFIAALSTSGQTVDCPRINAVFQGEPLIQIIEQLRQQNGYAVYYKTEWLDSITYSGKVENACLNDFLLGAINNERFTIYDYDGKTILSYNQPLIAISNQFLQSDSVTQEPESSFLIDLLLADKNQNQSQEVIQLGTKSQSKNQQVTVTGYVTEQQTKLPIIGALVYLNDKSVSTLTDLNGFYSLTIPAGKHILNVQYSGMKDYRSETIVFSDGQINIELQESIISLNEVVITADRNSQFENTEMGVERLDIETIKTVPKVLGENDIVRATLTLPGVSNSGEAAQGFNVRGGGTDQNLILYNNLTVYNPSHFFGFFSIFSEDFVKTSELFKSYIPAKYGGRLSSVLSINSGDVSTDTLEMAGGINPITGRLSVSTPIIKNKLAIKVGTRLTYSQWVLKQADSREVRDSDAKFYDLAFRAKYTVNKNNSLYVNAYRSKDSFNLLSDSTFSYSNSLVGLEWYTDINPQLNGHLSLGLSEYRYEIENNERSTEAFRLDYGIKEYSFLAGIDHTLTNDIILNYGVNAKYLEIRPGSIEALADSSLVESKTIPTERGVESSIYLSSEWQITPILSLNAGIRYSSFGAIGPKQSYVYNNESRSVNTISDTVTLQGIFKKYHGPEYRISARTEINNRTSFKASYVRNRQYINLLSNSTSVSPIDIWKLSDEYIKPQIGDQYSIGIYKTSKNKLFENSIEVFYKTQSNLLEYKIGSDFILNESLASDILQGNGYSYGMEASIRKPQGRLNGWISYTYSRSFIEIDGEIPELKINDGAVFPSNFDRPHNINIVTNYKFNKRFSGSLNINYLSGRPVTVPLGQVVVNGDVVIYYSDRNEFRIPNYFRVDLGINMEGNHKKNKLAHGFWTLSIYNLFGRDNAYSVFFVESDSQADIRGFQLSIFDQPIPTITYNFRI